MLDSATTMISKVNVSGDFKDFLVNNNILTVMAAVTIAFSTGLMMRSLVGNIILPGLYQVIFKKDSPWLQSFAPISASKVSDFIKDGVSWILVILFTFLLIEYVIRRWLLKIPYKKPDDKKPAGVKQEVKPEMRPVPAPMFAAPVRRVTKQEHDVNSTNNTAGSVAGGEDSDGYRNYWRY